MSDRRGSRRRRQRETATENKPTAEGAGWPVDRPGRLASSTGRPGRRPGAQMSYSMHRSSFLCRPISVLSSSITSISSISSLPIILHLGEDFLKSEPISNVPQSITWRNRHTISAKSTHDLGLESEAQLSTGMHHTCLPYASP